MNFDRSNLLSNFSPAEADWGIEDPARHRKRFDSVSTSEYSQAQQPKDYATRSPALGYTHGGLGAASDSDFSRGLGGDDYRSQRGTNDGDFRPQNDPANLSARIEPSTENFQKYIRKYLSLHPPRAHVVEKFKYNLVLSNLLDDALVLSKNEQALNNLVQMRNSDAHYLPVFLKRRLHHDGIQLKIVNKKYVLLLPASLQSPVILLNTIFLVIFLVKQNQRVSSSMPWSSRLKLFKILLVIATRILKVKRAHATIEASRNLRSLDDFMIANCQINKVIITHVITLKEFDLFAFLNKNATQTSSSTSRVYSEMLRKHLDTLLTCLILNMKHSIREILPFSNGELLEKYCHINNVRVSTIYETPDYSSDDSLTLELLTAKLTIFNNHRRFFVCQLLTIHDSHLHNFFILTLCDHFNIDVKSCANFYTSSYKAAQLHHVFQTHTALLDQLFALNEKFKTLYSASRSADYANDDILLPQKFNSITAGPGKQLNEVFVPDSDLDLTNLIDKLSGIVVSLKYFKKYSQSIANLDNADEHEERLSIFGSFHDELKTCQELFGSCMNEYKTDFSAKFHHAGSSNSSQRNSQTTDDQFNLKSFHTSSSKTKKVSPNSSSNHVSHQHIDQFDSMSKSDKRSKRGSTGLHLGLLTVLEKPRHATIDQRVSSSNTPNGTHGSNRGSYNQAALESLTKKLHLGYPANRFSMASVNSNISGFTDLIASTQITTDEDDGGSPKTSFLPEGSAQGMSKAELERRLEESFTRIYNLESENYELKSKSPLSETNEVPLCEDGDEPLFGASKDSKFLRNLEETLSAKTPAGG